MYNKVDEEERKAIFRMAREEVVIGLDSLEHRYLCVDDVKEDFSDFGEVYYTKYSLIVAELACDYYIDLKTKEVYKREDI